MATMKGYGVIEPTVSWGWMEKEIPEPGPFEALCSPVAVLPCTSDVHNAHRRQAWPNRILGHEGVGRVEKVGSMVTDIKVGDIVAIPAVTPIWRGKEIAEGLKAQHGIDVNKSKIVLSDPIKSFGTFEIKCKLGSEVSGVINLLVIEDK